MSNTERLEALLKRLDEKIVRWDRLKEEWDERIKTVEGSPSYSDDERREPKFS